MAAHSGYGGGDDMVEKRSSPMMMIDAHRGVAGGGHDLEKKQKICFLNCELCFPLVIIRFATSAVNEMGFTPGSRR